MDTRWHRILHSNHTHTQVVLISDNTRMLDHPLRHVIAPIIPMATPLSILLDP